MLKEKLKMKKSIALLLLMLFAISACSLNPSSNNNGNNNNNNQPSNNNNGGEIDVNKILSLATIFPEVGDEVDLGDYINEDYGFGHTLSEYSFVSSDSSVIEINNYKAVCKASGYATVTVSGPEIETPAVVSFWTGSIAGEYKPYYPKKLSKRMTLEIGEVNEDRVSEFTLTISEFTYNTTPISAYEGHGTMFKNGTPFVVFDFDDVPPANFSPISDYLSLLGLDPSISDLGSNIYGYLTYDFEMETLNLKTVFCGSVIEFEVEVE